MDAIIYWKEAASAPDCLIDCVGAPLASIIVTDARNATAVTHIAPVQLNAATDLVARKRSLLNS